MRYTRTLAKWVTYRRLFTATETTRESALVSFTRSFRVSDKARMADIFLYWGSGSPPCFKVMIALEEKGLKYKDKILSFGKQEHKSEEVMKLNPRGQLPTLRHGDIIINDSLAACDFLERIYPNQGTQLLPSEPDQMALVLQRAAETLSMQKKINEDIVVYQWFTKKEDINQSLLEQRCEAARTELALWEGYLVQNGDQEFLAGKNFTQADVMFFPMIAFAVRVGLKLDKYPKMSAYYDRVKQRPSVQKVWPPHWKDSEAGTILADL